MIAHADINNNIHGTVYYAQVKLRRVIIICINIAHIIIKLFFAKRFYSYNSGLNINQKHMNNSINCTIYAYNIYIYGTALKIMISTSTTCQHNLVNNPNTFIPLAEQQTVSLMNLTSENRAHRIHPGWSSNYNIHPSIIRHNERIART